MIEADNSRRLLCGSPVCVLFPCLLWHFFFRRFQHFCCCAAARYVCVFCVSFGAFFMCAFVHAMVMAYDGVLVWALSFSGVVIQTVSWFGWLGVGTVAVCLLKRVGREAFRWMVSLGSRVKRTSFCIPLRHSLLVLVGKMRHIWNTNRSFAAAGFCFLMTYKTHLILYYFTKSVRKVIKALCHCFCFSFFFLPPIEILKLGSSSCQEGAYCNCVGNHGTLWEGVLCVLIGLSKLEESVVSISLAGIWKRNMECTRCEWSFLVTTDFDPIQCFGNSRLPWFFVNDVVVTTDFDPNYG
ncbi:hypothetical protein BDC45DRAFT_542280 [Circinella umbellata]|nr:hypothetical protein BDC45DRAFT_542280 [Circinella umbellata]